MPTTLYRFYNADDALLYVGIAGNPGRRFHQHANDKAWWAQVVRSEMEHFTTRGEAAAAEVAAIASESPLHNVIHNRGCVAVPTPTPLRSGRCDGTYWWTDTDGPFAWVTVDWFRSSRPSGDAIKWAKVEAERGVGALRALGFTKDIPYGCGETIWAIPCATSQVDDLIANIKARVERVHRLCALEAVDA